MESPGSFNAVAPPSRPNRVRLPRQGLARAAQLEVGRGGRELPCRLSGEANGGEGGARERAARGGSSPAPGARIVQREVVQMKKTARSGDRECGKVGAERRYKRWRV